MGRFVKPGNERADKSQTSVGAAIFSGGYRVLDFGLRPGLIPETTPGHRWGSAVLVLCGIMVVMSGAEGEFDREERGENPTLTENAKTSKQNLNPRIERLSLERFVGCGEGKAFAQSKFQVSCVIGRNVPMAREGFESDICPKRLGFDSNGKGSEQAEILGCLPLVDSHASIQ
jgi:hypothetical protein